MTVQNAGAGSFLDELQRAIQANPVPAALIGVGMLWMLTGGARTSAAAALFADASSRAADASAAPRRALAQAADTATDSLSRAAEGAKDTLGKATGAVAAVAGQATESLADAGASVWRQASSAGSGAVRVGGTIQSNLTETFERQPLLVGVVGLALGALVASAFPRTRIEQEALGEHADAAQQRAKEFASDQADKLTRVAKRTMEAVREEAETQGLTPEGLKQRATAVRDKAVSAVSGARPTGPNSTH